MQSHALVRLSLKFDVLTTFLSLSSVSSTGLFEFRGILQVKVRLTYHSDGEVLLIIDVARPMCYTRHHANQYKI